MTCSQCARLSGEDPLARFDEERLSHPEAAALADNIVAKLKRLRVTARATEPGRRTQGLFERRFSVTRPQIQLVLRRITPPSGDDLHKAKNGVELA